jgi:hypothetical protein
VNDEEENKKRKKLERRIKRIRNMTDEVVFMVPS